MSLQNILEARYKCPLCDYHFTERADLQSHMLDNHFLKMESFCEMTTPGEEGKCYKCGENRSPLTYIMPGTFYIPCWNCITNRFEKTQSILTVKEAIRDYFGSVVKDRFLQMFLLGVYFEATLSHTYLEFKNVLKLLQKREKQDRNSIWFLDWLAGFPKIICEDNVPGIKVVRLDDLFTIESEPDHIRVNDFLVRFPEYIPFDQRHHSRYNIFNQATDPKNTKRIRLKNKVADKCIKFWNGDGTWKSIFRIESLADGSTIPADSLSSGHLIVLQMVLMRNKNFARLIGELIDEFVENVGVFSDSAFLKNTIKVNPDLRSKANLSWLGVAGKEKEGFINVSILQ